MWFGLQGNDSTNVAFNHQGEGDDKGNARRESGLSLNFANGIPVGAEKNLFTFNRDFISTGLTFLNTLTVK